LELNKKNKKYMEKSFELRENGEFLTGIIINIPKETTINQIEEKFEIDTKNYNNWNINTIELLKLKSLVLVDNKYETPDLIIDWTTIDYEQNINKDFIDVSDSLYLAINKKVEVEVVYTALTEMKKNPESSISEIILKSLQNWIK
jgi:hypothetical protein